MKNGTGYSSNAVKLSVVGAGHARDQPSTRSPMDTQGSRAWPAPTTSFPLT